MSTMIATSSEPIMYHFGVGGAGNKAKSSPSTSHKKNANVVYQPDLSYRNFSTGIGGRGNFSKATRAQQPEDIDIIQLLQDSRAAPRIVSSQGKYHTGIGGFANIYEATPAEIEQARKHTESTRQWSLSEIARRREGSQNTSSSSGSSDSDEATPRTSIADSMRDLFSGRSSFKA